MGRTVRQKRKNRSSRPKVKQSNKPKKQLNPLGNSVIARNWDKKQTLTQNYHRLGLLTRLQAPAGGTEPTLTQGGRAGPAAAARKTAALGITSSGASGPGAIREVKVERDASGRIVRVLNDDGNNPLNDPLRALDSDSDDGEGGWEGIADGQDLEEEDDDDEEESGGGGDRKVVRELERLARTPVVKTPRHVSAREAEWLEQLVRRYGDDTAAMARDHRLNPMQQTAADIARRVRKWRGGTEA